MTQSATFSLWFEPSGDIAYKLQERIKKLSEKHDTPVFSPHVTLLGGISSTETSAIPLTDTLASSIEPLELSLTKAGYRDRFYQSLFIHIEESPQLKEARKNALQIFDISEDDYMPHLSLLYGDLSQKEKERILNLTGREFYDSFTVNGLVLVKTDGRPDQWKRIHSATFSSAR